MGLSFTQIVFTLLVVVAVWRVVGYLERRRRLDRPPAARAGGALDFEACPRCGAYVAKGERCPRCDR